MSAAHGTHDGLAFFACLVIIGLCIAMGHDIQETRTARTVRAAAHAIPIPQHKPTPPNLVGWIMDEEELYKPQHKTRIQFPQLAVKP